MGTKTRIFYIMIPRFWNNGPLLAAFLATRFAEQRKMRSQPPVQC